MWFMVPMGGSDQCCNATHCSSDSIQSRDHYWLCTDLVAELCLWAFKCLLNVGQRVYESAWYQFQEEDAANVYLSIHLSIPLFLTSLLCSGSQNAPVWGWPMQIIVPVTTVIMAASDLGSMAGRSDDGRCRGWGHLHSQHCGTQSWTDCACVQFRIVDTTTRDLGEDI